MTTDTLKAARKKSQAAVRDLNVLTREMKMLARELKTAPLEKQSALLEKWTALQQACDEKLPALVESRERLISEFLKMRSAISEKQTVGVKEPLV